MFVRRYIKIIILFFRLCIWMFVLLNYNIFIIGIIYIYMLEFVCVGIVFYLLIIDRSTFREI